MSPFLRYRSFTVVLLCAASTCPVVAAPPLPRAMASASVVELAKTQCYPKNVCVQWRRGWPSGSPPVCGAWETKTVCEPHVYNNPNKPSSSPDEVRVPKLIAKPKPWQFSQPPSSGIQPNFAPRGTMMRRRGIGRAGKLPAGRSRSFGSVNARRTVVE